MKKYKKMKIAAVLAAIAVAGSITVYAAYDSGSDPLISLSYLTDVFKPQIKSELEGSIADSVKDSVKNELKSEIANDIKNSVKNEIESSLRESLTGEIYDKVTKEYDAAIEAMQDQIDALSNEYAYIELKADQRLTATAACEMVVLSGPASVRCSAVNKGVVDCTDGVILYEGQTAPLNHKLLVPENGDGRGLTANGTVQLLVKGGYKIAG
ncbi:MAG: hypothetical protein E7578_02875 [Ruminococcaceae bacterium]|nr:hypothetical protein [Oscillospiraceae bacterium]